MEFGDKIDNPEILIILKYAYLCYKDSCYKPTCEHSTNRERVRHSKKHNFQISTVFKVLSLSYPSNCLIIIWYVKTNFAGGRKKCCGTIQFSLDLFCLVCLCWWTQHWTAKQIQLPLLIEIKNSADYTSTLKFKCQVWDS